MSWPADGFTRTCRGVPRLLVAKFSGSERPDRTTGATDAEVSVDASARTVTVTLGGETYELDRQTALGLSEDLEDALTRRLTFPHTVGCHREDGAYVVERRGADSAGHRKVFDAPDQCRRLYERLPAEFTAEDVTRSGVTGGRRHMLVWHYVEHPGYDCELLARQPLTARKCGGERR